MLLRLLGSKPPGMLDPNRPRSAACKGGASVRCRPAERDARHAPRPRRWPLRRVLNGRGNTRAFAFSNLLKIMFSWKISIKCAPTRSNECGEQPGPGRPPPNRATLPAGEAPRPHRMACSSLRQRVRGPRGAGSARISMQNAEQDPGSIHCQKFPRVHAWMSRPVPEFRFLRPNSILSKHFGQK